MRFSRRHPFEARYTVDTRTGCWIWIGSINPAGYGTFGSRHAHRVSWERHRGPIPKGLQVHHDCPGADNRRCVNPAHLWLGTQRENVLDMHAKGRGHKLTGRDIDEIRQLRGEFSYATLARRYGVAKSTIGMVMIGRNLGRFGAAA